MSPRELVLQQALALPLDDQAFVAQSLDEHLASQVPYEVAEEDGVSGAEFLAELKRRSAEFEADPTSAREWTAVLQDLERRQARETSS